MGCIYPGIKNEKPALKKKRGGFIVEMNGLKEKYYI